MEIIWRIRIQYYSLGTLVLISSILIHKYLIPDTYIIPFMGGVLLTLVFGNFMIKAEKIMNKDGTYKTDKDIEEGN